MRSAHPSLRDGDRALLVGLADGTLTGRRRAKAERRLAELGEWDARLERQRRVARLLRSGPEPPSGLAATLRSAAPHAGRRSLTPRLAVAAAAGLVVAVAVTLAIALSSGAPTVAQATDLGLRPATAAAPPVRQGRPALLAAGLDGVAFPAWGAEFGWKAVGVRTDRLDGRRARTVFYEHRGHRIAYTIVSGAALAAPAGGELVGRDGLDVTLLHHDRHGGHDIAVFERNGRTCVLAGHVESRSTLVKLASWRGGGTLRS